MTTALAAATNTEGIVALKAARGEVAHSGKGQRNQDDESRRTHLRTPGLDDQQNARKARERRQPAPQSDFLGIEDRGPGRHEQRRDLEHRIDSGQRYIAKRNDDEGRGRASCDQAQRHHWRQENGKRTGGAEHRDTNGEQGGGQHAPDDNDLARGQFVRHQLDGGVIDHERRGRDQNCDDAAQVVGHVRPAFASLCSRKKV